MSGRRGTGMPAWELVQRIIAALLLVPALPLACAMGLLIRLRSPGPILLRQPREGRDGVPFRMYKLRTMIVDAGDALRRHLASDPVARREWLRHGRLAADPRIAGRVARFARRASIDELPQLLNVVFGDMNLIGPRPLPADIAHRMAPADRRARQRVRPGITGLWQVSGRSELTIREIGQADRRYVEARTIRRDVLILLRTPRAVLSGRGAY